MELNWLQSLFFGLVSGITEILPVSAPAHEALVMKFLGIGDNPLLRLVVHIAVLSAIFVSLRAHVQLLLRERRLSRVPARRRVRHPDPILIQELKLLRTAVMLIVAGAVVTYYLKDVRTDLSSIAVFLMVNGIILYIPGHIPNGNKDARSMSPLDGTLLGIGTSFAMIPGLSRIGTVSSIAVARGADKEHSLRWAMLLDLVAMVVVLGLDAVDLLAVGLGAISGNNLICCVVAALAAFGGTMVGIHTMKFLAFRVGFSGFAYYSWGAALFSFLMYLTI